MPDKHSSFWRGVWGKPLENCEYVPVPHLLFKRIFFQVPPLSLGELYWNKQYIFR